jgi:hypothetical protein
MEIRVTNNCFKFWPCKSFRGKSQQRSKAGSNSFWIFVAAIAASITIAGCNPPQTMFRSNLDQTVEGQPPSSMQDVGTAQIFGPVGSVTVVAPPVLPSGKWLRISRPNGPDVAGFQGTFSQFGGDGVYTFSTTMFMPSGSGVATIQFETFTNPVSSLSAFLHLDFTENNQIRIDDNEGTKFGSFPRDQPFIVQVTLDINAAASTARIILSGAGASGQSDYTVISPFQNMSRQFGAIRLWQGFPHTGAFEATNIAVTRAVN